MGLLSRARRHAVCSVCVYLPSCAERRWPFLRNDSRRAALSSACLPPFHLRLCFVRLRYVPRSPCKSQRKGHASPEWLAGSEMPDFIYRAVNMSLKAAGFLGLSSLTGHLIMRPLAVPDRKHAFCFSRNDAAVDFVKMQSFPAADN